MDELANQWYQAGSLLLQAGFLIAGVWSVRSILRNMRASQEQVGALLRITVSGSASEDGSLRAAARPTPYLVDGWPEATANSVAATEAAHKRDRHGKTVWS